MSEGTKRTWAVAMHAAERIVELLASSCKRLEIAGSLRRKATLVGDIELVAIANHLPDLLGNEAESQLDIRLQTLLTRGDINPLLKAGDRYKQFAFGDPPLKVDLFITTVECWGVVMAIRTGPVSFAKRLVTQAAHGGLLLNGLSVSEGRVWRGRIVGEDGVLECAGEALQSSTEEEFFKLTSCGWLDPEER